LNRILKTRLTRREFLVLSAVGLLSFYYDHKPHRIEGVWTNYTAENSILKPGGVSHVVIDRQGGLWIAQGSYPDTGAYMCHYDGKRWYGFQTNKGQIFSDDVCHISVDPMRDWLWIGGWLGLTIINTISKESFDAGINLCENITYGPFTYDGEGNVWVATEGGIAEYYGKGDKYDKSKWRFFASQESYLHDQHSNDSRWSFVRELICDRAFAIAADKHDSIWVGTAKGVSRYDGRTELWTSYTEEDGLIDNLIWDIKPDNSGNIWFIRRRSHHVRTLREGKIRSERKDPRLCGFEVDGIEGVICFGGGASRCAPVDSDKLNISHRSRIFETRSDLDDSGISAVPVHIPRPYLIEELSEHLLIPYPFGGEPSGMEGVLLGQSYELLGNSPQLLAFSLRRFDPLVSEKGNGLVGQQGSSMTRRSPQLPVILPVSHRSSPFYPSPLEVVSGFRSCRFSFPV